MDKADFIIKFCCENCGHKISVQDKHTGKRCKCPRCDSIVVVPGKSTIVDFHCESCGQIISVPQVHAGKKCKCPKCKSIVLVPTLKQIPAQKAEASVQPGQEEGVFEMRLEAPQQPEGETEAEETEPVAERKLPWIIDALFYPISISGGIHLAVFFCGPFVVGLVSRYVLSGFFILGAILSLLLYILYVGYVFYYLAYCVFDSSKGGWRAPDISLQPIPDKGDLISQLLRICGCFAVCFWPLAVYYILTERANLVFWLLFALGSFFLPMALLAGVLFDSFDALNPVLIIRSIYKTFLPYCLLVPLFCVLALLVVRIISDLPRPGNYLQVLGYGFLIVHYLCSKSFVYHTLPLFYLAMVATHFLGRFYWWHKDKLDWGL